MEYQRDIHEESWESRKPEQDAVAKKPRIRATMDLLESVVEDGDHIFDLGCGDGTMGALLDEEYAITIDGCDISEVAVERARNHYRTVYRLNIDDEDVPAESHSYDIVLCTDVLEHTLSPVRALNEIRRLLKDDGIAILSVPNYGFVRYRIDSVRGQVPSIISDERHYSAFTVSRLRNILSDCGLTPETVLGVSRLQRLAKVFPSIFAKTIILTASPNPTVSRADDFSRDAANRR